VDGDDAIKRAEEYLKFMKLKVEQPAAQLAPSHAVDQVWHCHILDTRSYQQLQTILMPDGGFVHHNPVLDDQPHYEARYANTLSLLSLKYGEPLDAASWEIDNHAYKALQIVFNSVENREESITAPRVYCHKEADCTTTD
jgi:hypothetical protein